MADDHARFLLVRPDLSLLGAAERDTLYLAGQVGSGLSSAVADRCSFVSQQEMDSWLTSIALTGSCITLP